MNPTNNELKIHTGTPQSATPTSITLDINASDLDGAYTMHTLKIIEGTGRGEQHTIKSYDGRTRVATLHGTWTTTPDTTSVYAIIDPEPAELRVPTNIKADLKAEFESLKEIHGLTFQDAFEVGMKETIRKARFPEEIRRRINRKQDEIFGLYSQLHRAIEVQKQSEEDTDFRWDRDGRI